MANDKHPMVCGGEVQPYDDDELESLRDGNSVVAEFDSDEEDVCSRSWCACSTWRVGRGQGSSAVFGRCGSGHNLLDPSVRHAEHSSFLAGPVLHLHAFRYGRNYSGEAVPTILSDTPEGGNCFCCCHACCLAGFHAVESSSRERLLARIDRFSAGDWQDLIRQSS